MVKIIAFAGSSRVESLNKRLVAFAADRAREMGVEVTLIDLREFPMPLYDGDLEKEEGIPPAADRLFQLMKEHQAMLLSCPEYNSSITPLLKNTIDWLTRPREGERPLAAFDRKAAALMSASPGTLGGLRGLVTVRSILGNIGVFVLPNQIAVPKAHEVISKDGTIRDDQIEKRITSVVNDLVQASLKLF